MTPLPLRDSGIISELLEIGRRGQAAAEAKMGPAPEWPEHPCARCVRVNAIAHQHLPPNEAESYLVPVDRKGHVRRWSSLCRECADLEWSAAWELRRVAAAGDHARLAVLERQKQERIVKGRWIQPVRGR